MGRRLLLLIVVAGSLGVLAFVRSSVPGLSSPVVAVSDSGQNPFAKLPAPAYHPLSQGEQIDCTVSITTTDSLNDINACEVDETVEFCAQNKATTLANYDNLALVDYDTDSHGAPPQQRPVHDDWFRLDNAEVGALYTVEAVPDRTRNYNLGVVVYDMDHNEVTRDKDAVDNAGKVTFEPENEGPYFFRVFQITEDCTGRTYHLNYSRAEPPTATPPPRSDEDAYEPNNSFDQAMAEGPTLPIRVPHLLELTFHSTEDIDYFRFYTKDGRWYEATTSDLNLVDSLLEVYDRDRKRIDRNDDGAGGLASTVSWRADYDGYYFIVIQNNVDSRGSYNLTLDQVSSPATRTPGASPLPDPTPRARADDCEENLDFDHACVIPANEDLTFNFVPVFGEGPDNDFYKIWVKPGLHFRCATSNLAPGVDPNMIVFNGPSWEQAVGGNDDVSPADFNSAFNYYATYSGWLYLLVGTGDRTPSDLLNSSYTLRCDMSAAPLSATSTPEPTTAPSATPTTAQSPVATPTAQDQSLSIRPLTTPTPIAPSAPRFLPIDLLVYYDANGDGVPGAGEGITGIPAMAYDVSTNQLLAQGHTDLDGQLLFTVAAQGSVRLSIPFLDFSHSIPGDTDTQEGASIRVRVPPRGSTSGAP